MWTAGDVTRRGFFQVAAGSAAMSAMTASPEIPRIYLRHLEEGMARVEARFRANPDAGLKELESRPEWRHFPSVALAAALLATRHADAEVRRHMLGVTENIGDLLAGAQESGYYGSRLDHHRDTYMWLDAYRLVQDRLTGPQRQRWGRALQEQLTALAGDVARVQDRPAYQAPFIVTSTNHLSLWSSTLYLGGKVFRNAAWEQLAAKVLHRLAGEQSPDGYWGEHSSAGPTTGYDYVTTTGVALYWEHSGDPAALQALRRSTDFHEYFTWPDGTPVETINDRNRYWEPSMWAHFGFSNFPDGRRYAEFLASFYEFDPESLGRMAQNALYWHPGPTAPIPQDKPAYVRRMAVPAGIRKSGPWSICLSGLISTQAQSNQFFLDRQGHLSIFHEKCGLIITGANSKRQPELATFAERFGDLENHLPTSSRLEMNDSGDKLALAYNTFFAEVKMAPPAGGKLSFEVAVTETDDAQSRLLQLQLCVKPGSPLETAAGQSIVPGESPVKLGPEQIGAWIRHNGWTLKVPPGTHLEWPVQPFNPYRNRPESGLHHAVGVLRKPIASGGEVMAFELTAS